jgi:hypothetical protein
MQLRPRINILEKNLFLHDLSGVPNTGSLKKLEKNDY